MVVPAQVGAQFAPHPSADCQSPTAVTTGIAELSVTTCVSGS